ncbi:MAG: hypothetical protein IPJ71_03270 [Bdellovibrionales bacterium]|nr:hypothetical protein [Bdellovibrionales bacterium]
MLAFILGWIFLSRVSNFASPGQARSMAMALLTSWSAGIAFYLPCFRSHVANILSFVTVLSSVALIQISDHLKFLHLVPLRLTDWLIIAIIVPAMIALLSFLRKVNRK